MKTITDILKETELFFCKSINQVYGNWDSVKSIESSYPSIITLKTDKSDLSEEEIVDLLEKKLIDEGETILWNTRSKKTKSRIDLLTERKLFEVKKVLTRQKLYEAIGQLIIYSFEHSNKELIIVGGRGNGTIDKLIPMVHRWGIKVQYIEIIYEGEEEEEEEETIHTCHLCQLKVLSVRSLQMHYMVDHPFVFKSKRMKEEFIFRLAAPFEELPPFSNEEDMIKEINESPWLWGRYKKRWKKKSDVNLLEMFGSGV